MFVLSPTPIRSILFSPFSHKSPKCAPLFTKAEYHHYIFDATIKHTHLNLGPLTRSYGSIQKSKRILGLRTTNTTLKARALTIKNEAGNTPVSFSLIN
ncbi:hypothetical protein HanIR_Chr00c08g0906651 [Helianthus annuus]|nr:hypothetical protein HanIR_Chr00c08g0906651 [Helianthus annuus]